MGRLLDENDVYALFARNGIARLHVADIDALPRVDAVEVVHGRWVRKAHDGAFGVFHLWHCSVCDTIRARQDPYCGECGAKMEVENG